jgi:hypothetical protein
MNIPVQRPSNCIEAERERGPYKQGCRENGKISKIYYLAFLGAVYIDLS